MIYNLSAFENAMTTFYQVISEVELPIGESPWMYS